MLQKVKGGSLGIAKSNRIGIHTLGTLVAPYVPKVNVTLVAQYYIRYAE